MKKHILFLYSAIFLYFFAFFVLPPLTLPYNAARAVKTDYSFFTVFRFALLSVLLYTVSTHAKSEKTEAQNSLPYGERKANATDGGNDMGCPWQKTAKCIPRPPLQTALQSVRVFIIGLLTLFALTFTLTLIANTLSAKGMPPIQSPAGAVGTLRFCCGVVVFAFFEELLFRAFLPCLVSLLAHEYASFFGRVFCGARNRGANKKRTGVSILKRVICKDTNIGKRFKDEATLAQNFRLRFDSLSKAHTRLWHTHSNACTRKSPIPETAYHIYEENSQNSAPNGAARTQNNEPCTQNGASHSCKNTNRTPNGAALANPYTPPAPNGALFTFTVNVVCTLLFAFSHRYLGSLSVVHAFLCGAVFVLQTKKTGTVWSACITHSVYNLCIYAAVFLGVNGAQ